VPSQAPIFRLLAQVAASGSLTDYFRAAIPDVLPHLEPVTEKQLASARVVHDLLEQDPANTWLVIRNDQRLLMGLTCAIAMLTTQPGGVEVLGVHYQFQLPDSPPPDGVQG
jgi:hypothetical protein